MFYDDEETETCSICANEIYGKSEQVIARTSAVNVIISVHSECRESVTAEQLKEIAVNEMYDRILLDESLCIEV